MENNEVEPSREIIMEKEHRLGELSDSVKHNNIHIIEVPEEEEKKRAGGAESLFQEIIAAGNFSNLGKKTDTEIQKAQRIPIKINKSI